MTVSRKLQELIIAHYPDRSFEEALDIVKRRNRGLLTLLTDDAVYEIAMTLGDHRRLRNRLNAENRARAAAYRERIAS
jgi:hypothetical protein